jgi:hypothetical protein
MTPATTSLYEAVVNDAVRAAGASTWRSLL